MGDDGPALTPRTAAELDAGLDWVTRAPRDRGTLRLLVTRPEVDRREVLTHGRVEPGGGLVGDGWLGRGSAATPDGQAERDRELTLIGARFAELISGSGDPELWALAGDQLVVDLDLSQVALPPGTRLVVGEPEDGRGAVLAVTPVPHTGCAKFASRYGREAHKLVWSDHGKRLRLRGMYARVVTGGTVSVGDPITVRHERT